MQKYKRFKPRAIIVQFCPTFTSLLSKKREKKTKTPYRPEDRYLGDGEE